MGAMFIVHALLLTATGYSLTLLMASLFRRLIALRVLWTMVLSFATVVLAAGIFSAIETWSYATFLKPDYQPVGPRISRRAAARFRAADRLVVALLRDQLLPAARGGDRPARPARAPGLERPAGDAALPAQPALPVQYAQQHLDPGAAEADRARQCDARAPVLVPALHARQRADRPGHAGAGGRDAEALPRDREDALRGPASAAFPDRRPDHRRPAAVAAAPAADRKRHQICGDPERDRRRHLDQRRAPGPRRADRSVGQRRRHLGRPRLPSIDRGRPRQYPRPPCPGLWPGARISPPGRTKTGGSALSSIFRSTAATTDTTTRTANDHPHHPRRRRAARDAGTPAAAPGA